MINFVFMIFNVSHKSSYPFDDKTQKVSQILNQNE